MEDSTWAWIYTIDNNASGRAIKGFGIGKKNWQVIDTMSDAKASVIFYSIVEQLRQIFSDLFDFK